MSTLLVSHDAKNNQVTLRGRNLDGTYPANGYLVASQDPNGSNFVILSLPGSNILEREIDYKQIHDAATNLDLGANATATITALNDSYFNVDTSLNGFDDVNYDPTSLNNDYILQWNTDHWAGVELTPVLVGAMDADASLDDLSDVDAGNATDGQVLTWVDADGEWKPQTASGGGGGATVVDDLTDVDTTGVATGDGLKYDGTDFVAGKWGVGAENQVVPANTTSSGSTTRTITLDTDTTFPTNLTSVTTLDVVDSAGNLMESIRSLEIDVGAGPTYTATQNKYGILTNKKDANGNIGKVGFNNQYADGGNNMYLQCDNITASWNLNLPATNSTTTGQVLAVASSTTSLQTDLEWVTPSSGGGGSVYTFTDTGRRQWSSTQDNYYHVGDSGFGMNDTSKNYAIQNITSGTGLADLLMFNGWTMPEDVTTVKLVGHCNTFSANLYSEDMEVILLKVVHTSGDDCTLTNLNTETVTMGSSSGDVLTFDTGSVSASLSAGDVVIPVFRFPSASMTATCYLRYGCTLTAS